MYLKYPIDVNNGDIALTDDYDTYIQDAIRHCLLTVQEERVLRPEYGLPDVLFSATTLQELNALIIETLQVGLEGYNVLLNTSCDFSEDGLLAVQVYYAENKKVEVLLNVSP